jgi:hypothetical protein
VVAYDVESDGSPNSPPAGFNSTLDRGWIRGTTTATHSVSNASFGGAKPTPFAYDDDVFHRIVLAAQPFRSESITLTVGAVLSQAVSSSSTTFQHQHVDVVDERFAAAASSLSTGQTVPNNSGLATGQPWTALTATQDTATYDPRLTAVSFLNQYDDDDFGSPPMSKDDTNQRLTSQLAFLATRIVNARNEGINGLTVTQTLTPVSPGTAETAPSSTATRGGEAGWTDFLTWDAALPGGDWILDLDVTSPSDIDLASYLLGSGTQTFTLLAANPAISVRCSIHNLSGTGSHPVGGDTIRVIADAFDVNDQERKAGDVGGVNCNVTRYNTSANRVEYWDGAAWQTLAPNGAPTTFALTAAPSDSNLYFRDFPTDAAWGNKDIRIEVTFKITGVPYWGWVVREFVDAKNRHDRSEADPLTLLDSGRPSLK